MSAMIMMCWSAYVKRGSFVSRFQYLNNLRLLRDSGKDLIYGDYRKRIETDYERGLKEKFLFFEVIIGFWGESALEVHRVFSRFRLDR